MGKPMWRGWALMLMLWFSVSATAANGWEIYKVVS